MGFNFNFLKDLNKEKEVAGNVFSFLKKPVVGAGRTIENAIQYGPSAFAEAVPKVAKGTRDIAVSSARSIPRSFITAGTEYGNFRTGQKTPDTVFTPSDPVSKFLLGKEPVKSFSGVGKDIGVGGKGGAFLGAGLTSLDLTGYGKGGKTAIEQLVKATTEQQVKKIIPNVTPEIASAITKTQSPDVIANLLKGTTSIPKEIPQVIPPVDKTANVISDVSTPAKTALPPTTSIVDATVPKAPVEKQRKFLETTQKSDIITPEAKQKIADTTPQTYTQKPNQKLVDKSQAIAPDQRQAVKEDLLSKEHYTDQDVANSAELIRNISSEQKAAKEAGDTILAESKADEAAKLAVVIDTKLRASGRTVQAASLFNRLTPEGQLKFTAQKIGRAAEKADKYNKAGKVAGDIQKTVEDAGQIDRNIVTQAVKDSANGTKKTAEDLTTGEKVAKKVETAVTPQVKKKADILVDEITKKIKQEQLTPLPKAQKKSPTEILKEVFSRNKEAQDAFPEAQRILRDKFKDNPEAMKTLDKFFNSELGLPAASTTIDSAIKEQLIKNETKISQIIHDSWSNQKQSVEDVAKNLTANGFDEQSAKTIAKEVTDRLNTQVATAKQKAIEGLASKVPKTGQTTYAEKITKLSNLGVLDKQDYLDLARGKLKLPHLTSELAGKVSEMAQKLQALPDGSPEQYLVAQEIGELIAGATPMTKGKIVSEVGGAPRALLSSGDISSMGRQGLVLGTRFPKQYKDAFGKQVKYLGDEKHFKEDMAKIASDPLYKQADESGLALTGVSKRPEEAYESTILESKLAKKLGIGHLVGKSNRSYTGALTNLRFDVFKNIVNDMKTAGKEMSKEELDSLAYYINVSTGRGGKPGGWLDKNGAALSQGLFSPQLWASRLKPLSLKYYYDLKGPARKLALQNAGTFAGVAGSVLTLAALAGAQVETDARSSDFLKIKVGDTRYDILGGFQQNLVFAHRLITGEKKSTRNGAITELAPKYGGADRFTLLFDLIQNKEAPVPATISRVLKQQDRAGNDLTIGGEIAGLTIPLSMQETFDQVKKKGIVGIPGSLPGYVGLGSQTYGISDIKPSDKQEEYLTKLKSSGAPQEKIDASKSLFQYIKAAPSKDSASEEVKKALTNNDLPKAKKLAEEYNQKYADSFKDWREKYPQYKTDPNLVKAFKGNTITSESISRWISAIKKGEKL